MPGSRRHVALGMGLAAFSAFCYAWMPIFAKSAYRAGATPLQLLSLRFLFALPLFWGTVLAVRRREAAVSSRRAVLFLLTGLFFGVASVCMFQAYRFIHASLAVLLLYTYPALVALWGKLLHKEALGPARLLSLALTFGGVVLTVGVSTRHLSAGSGLGIALALAAGFLFSLYTLVAQHVVAGTGPLVFTAWTVTATFALTAFLAPPWEALGQATWPVVSSALWLAVVSTFLAIYAYAKGIQHIGATRAAVVSNLEIVGVVALSYLLLGERLTLLQVAGGALILAGVSLLQMEPGVAAGGPSGGQNHVDTVRA